MSTEAGRNSMMRLPVLKKSKKGITVKSFFHYTSECIRPDLFQAVKSHLISVLRRAVHIEFVGVLLFLLCYNYLSETERERQE